MPNTPVANAYLDRQPLGSCTLRRCPRIRDWLSHHIFRRTVSLLWCEDRPVTLRQAYRERGELRERCLVGPSKQANVARCEYNSLHTASGTWTCTILGCSIFELHIAHASVVGQRDTSCNALPNALPCPALRDISALWTLSRARSKRHCSSLTAHLLLARYMR